MPRCEIGKRCVRLENAVIEIGPGLTCASGAGALSVLGSASVSSVVSFASVMAYFGPVNTNGDGFNLGSRRASLRKICSCSSVAPSCERLSAMRLCLIDMNNVLGIV